VRLGIVILAHRDPEQLALLLRLLAHDSIRTYLHLDRRVDDGPFRRALAATEQASTRWLPRYATRWGGVELVDASLEGLRAARREDCDYVVLISGQDVPLMTAGDLVDFYEARRGRSYLEHVPLPDERWQYGGRLRTECYTFTVRGRRETHRPPRFRSGDLSWRGRLLNAALGLRVALLPPREPPEAAELWGGSQWWNLDAEAVAHVLDFVEDHPDYRAWHRHTLIPDEIFFQSILAGTRFRDRHPLVDDHLRFMRWDEDASHPRDLDVGDLEDMLASGRPFARKVVWGEDGGLLSRLHATGDR